MQELQKNLVRWYEQNSRPLPWRKKRDPYQIWISEVMLQQTTVTAVIPYYERFLKSFPTLKELAQANEGDVLKLWSGLGYYSRARNMLKSAKLFVRQGFPKTHTELAKFPGFGPYTSRAVTSIAFGENVGVLDGNVIRILSRVFALNLDWWKTEEKNKLQNLADKIVRGGASYIINQAMMDLGSEICTPKNPRCLLCPWTAKCQARLQSKVLVLPKLRPRKKIQTWIWEPVLILKKDKVALIKNDYAPFLKGQWLLPGKARQSLKVPKKFDFKHSITHHKIIVKVKEEKSDSILRKWQKNSTFRWVKINELSQIAPASMIQKAIMFT